MSFKVTVLLSLKSTNCSIHYKHFLSLYHSHFILFCLIRSLFILYERDGLEWNEQQTTARKWMADALRIGDHSEALKLINERTVVMTLSENHIISEQNAEEERLVLVVSGTLVLSQV